MSERKRSYAHPLPDELLFIPLFIRLAAQEFEKTSPNFDLYEGCIANLGQETTSTLPTEEKIMAGRSLLIGIRGAESFLYDQKLRKTVLHIVQRYAKYLMEPQRKSLVLGIRRELTQHGVEEFENLIMLGYMRHLKARTISKSLIKPLALALADIYGLSGKDEKYATENMYHRFQSRYDSLIDLRGEENAERAADHHFKKIQATLIKKEPSSEQATS